jgi:hypothetical protein
VPLKVGRVAVLASAVRGDQRVAGAVTVVAEVVAVQMFATFLSERLVLITELRQSAPRLPREELERRLMQLCLDEHDANASMSRFDRAST